MPESNSLVSNERLNQKELLALRLAIHDKIYELSKSKTNKPQIKILKDILEKFHQVKIRCQYSGCREWRGVKHFYSYEEGTVSLCKKHREINEGKTGYTEQNKEKSEK